jgi:hypothetical protein
MSEPSSYLSLACDYDRWLEERNKQDPAFERDLEVESEYAELEELF